jgi:Ca2+-binding EF-hand superfamily protein
LSYSEFSTGINKIITLSEPIKEKLFALMDSNEIGLVDYPNFLEVIQMSNANKLKRNGVKDNFEWEEGIIDKIKMWIIRERITVEEAFKCFDRDFDGTISKEDLKDSLISIFKIKPDEIFPTKLDRLFKLMDFYKTNGI